MERETGIEPASLAWKARVLPLNYSRIGQRPLRTQHHTKAGSSITLNTTTHWWRGLDSNQCRRKPTDLQSAPFSHSGIPPEKNSIVASFSCFFFEILRYSQTSAIFEINQKHYSLINRKASKFSLRGIYFWCGWQESNPRPLGS